MKFLPIPILLVFSFNCVNTNLRLSEKNLINKKPSVSITSHFFLGGIFQNTDIDLVEECFGKEPLLIVEKYNWISFFTLGFYTPRISEIFCEQ